VEKYRELFRDRQRHCYDFRCSYSHSSFLYTVILPDDEDVEKIAIQGIKTIPDLRKLMKRELNSISESSTIH
jgi:hypothetical protein